MGAALVVQCEYRHDDDDGNDDDEDDDYEMFPQECFWRSVHFVAWIGLWT